MVDLILDGKMEKADKETVKRLLMVTSNNSNYVIKKAFQRWTSEKIDGRDLTTFHAERLNTGALILDDTEYTRRLALYTQARHPDLRVYVIEEELTVESLLLD